MDRYAAFDHPTINRRASQSATPKLIEAPADMASRRLSPLASLIIVSVLSLGIWAAIWAALVTLLS